MGKTSTCKNGGEHAIKGHVSTVSGRLSSAPLNTETDALEVRPGCGYCDKKPPSDSDAHPC